MSAKPALERGGLEALRGCPAKETNMYAEDLVAAVLKTAKTFSDEFGGVVPGLSWLAEAASIERVPDEMRESFFEQVRLEVSGEVLASVDSERCWPSKAGDERAREATREAAVAEATLLGRRLGLQKRPQFDNPLWGGGDAYVSDATGEVARAIEFDPGAYPALCAHLKSRWPDEAV